MSDSDSDSDRAQSADHTVPASPHRDPSALGDPNSPPSREGLLDAEVWEWSDDHWQVRLIAPFEATNVGGSPDPVEEP